MSKTYLGDGVYAEVDLDSWSKMITLTIGSDYERNKQVIYLNKDVWDNLKLVVESTERNKNDD